MRDTPLITGGLSRVGLLAALAVGLSSFGAGHGRTDPPEGRKEKTDEAPKGALVSPGPDTEKGVEFLRRIKDGRIKADRARGDMLVRGRFSQVVAEPKKGMADLTPEQLPPPQWCQFLLVHKGEKRRYDAHWVNDVPGSEFLATSYALTDGKAVYRLSGAELTILDRDREKWTWEKLADRYFRFGHVHDGLNDGPVDIVCQTLIDRITQGKDSKDADFWKSRVLRCYGEDGLLVVENDGAPGRKSRYRYRFWVDPKRGYQVVRHRDEQGGPGRPVNYRCESRVDLAEVAPGVFLPKRASEFTSNDGVTMRCDMEADQLKVGDVKYAADLFEPSSLPVPKDVVVTDRRNGRVIVTPGESVDIEAALLPAGKPAPPFEVPLLGGGAFKSKDVLGAKKHVLVIFWSCTCPPCAAELGYLNEIQAGFRNAGVEVVAVNLGDEADAVRKHVKDRGLKLPVGLGGNKFEGSEVGKAYGVHAIPTTYLICPDGTILWRKTGFDKAELNDALKKAGYRPEGSGGERR
jgi:peroxiredoxin